MLQPVSRFMRQYLIILLYFLLSACGERNTSVIDQQVLDEMDRMEPKRVMPEQLVNATYRRGARLTRQLLSLALYQQQSDSLSLARYLSQQSYDTLSARVRWVDYQSDTLQLKPYEQLIWSAYRYSTERAEPLADNVQRLNGDSLLYTQPVVLVDSLADRWPASSDTLGQLLGMWSVTLPKKDVVLSVE